MKEVLSIEIAEDSAQSLIKIYFGALHMCDSPFLELGKKWCYKLLCNELIWGFPYNTHENLERLHFGLSAKDATQLCGTTKKGSCLLLSMSQIFGSLKLTKPIQKWCSRRKGSGATVPTCRCFHFTRKLEGTTCSDWELCHQRQYRFEFWLAHLLAVWL